MNTGFEAAFEAGAMHAMQDAGLDRAARYNTSDCCSSGNWGLFDRVGDLRPALYPLAFWRQMAPLRMTVRLTDPASLARDKSRKTRYGRNPIASIDLAGGLATHPGVQFHTG